MMKQDANNPADREGLYGGSMKSQVETFPEIELPPRAIRRMLPPSYTARILRKDDAPGS
jgi:hypothetical protein